MERFQTIVIERCDENDPINNPHNYNFGGTFAAVDGLTYMFQPLPKQIDEVSCDVSYKFVFNGFERGTNLPDASFGTNVEGLKRQLQGCGALTRWHIERTPNDVYFQWFASGQLPLGTKACIGRALMTAGGSDNGNCH